MKVYIGEPVGKMVEFVKKKGWGAVITPFQFRKPYPLKFNFFFVDNGAYALYLQKKPFDGYAFLKTLERVEKVFAPQKPDFVVLPDIIEGGYKSLEFSLKWYERLIKEFSHFNYALVLQDGIKEESIEEVLNETGIKIIFVGGSTAWKMRTGKSWVELARKRGIHCHIGRVGTYQRVRWAMGINAHSIDSALPLFSKAHMRRFIKALSQPVQLTLF